MFAALTILAISYSAYSLAALGYTTLTGDTGAQYYLAKITSEGAVPLVDFQHGWNTGSWWASAVLYRIAGGDPTLWWFLWGRLLGVGLAAVLVAGIGLRLRLAPSAMVTMALGVLILVPPAHLKYALPVLWVFALLPSKWLDRGRGRAGRLLSLTVRPLLASCRARHPVDRRHGAVRARGSPGGPMGSLGSCAPLPSEPGW